MAQSCFDLAMITSYLRQLSGFGLAALFAASPLAQASLDIGGILTIEGSIPLVTQGLFEVGAAENLDVYIGEGDGFLPNGDVDPAARGVFISNATVGIVKSGSDYAVVATGSAGSIGLPGITIAGTLTARVNMLSSAVNETITVPGSPTTVNVAFSPAETAAGPGSPFSSITGGGFATDLAGQLISGDLAVHKLSINRNGGTEVALNLGLANASTSFSSGMTDLVSMTDASGNFLALFDGVAGSLDGNVSVAAAANVGLYRMEINTTGTAVDQSFVAGGTAIDVSVTAGNFVRIVSPGSLLDILGQTLSGDFLFQQEPGGDVVVQASGVTTSFSDGPANLLSMGDGSGVIVLSPAGAAGQIDGPLSVNVPDVALAGGLQLAINSTGLAVNRTVSANGLQFDLNLEAGSYVKMRGSNINLALGGQSLLGDFEFQQTPAGVVASASEITSVFGNGIADLLTLNGATGIMLLTSNGAGTILNGTLASSDPAASLAGAFDLQINTTGLSINKTVTIGGITSQLDLAAGPFVSLTGQNAQLAILGSSVAADFYFEKSGENVIGQASNAALTIDDGATDLLSLGNSSGVLFISPSGTAMQLSGELALAVPGTTTSGPFTASANTGAAAISENFSLSGKSVSLALPGGPFIRVAGADASLTVYGKTIVGDLVFEKEGTSAIKGLVSNGASTLGDNLIVLAELTGPLLLSADGAALELTGNIAPAVPGLVSASPFSLQINGTGSAIDQTFGLGGTSYTINLADGTFQTVGLGATIEVAGLDLNGDFIFQEVSPEAINLIASDVSFSMGFGILTVTDGAGAFRLSAAGAAGVLSLAGTAFSAPNVTLGGAANRLEINTGTAAISETLNVSGQSILLDLPGGPFIRVAGADTYLTVNGKTIIGDLILEEEGTSAIKGLVSNGASTLGTNLVALSNLTGAVLIIPSGAALELTGNIASAVPGLVSASPFSLQINGTGSAIDQTFGLGGTSYTINLADGTFQTVGLGSTIEVAGLDLTGDFSFEEVFPGIIHLLANDVGFSMGAGILTATGGAGTLRLNANGAAGVLSLGGTAFSAPHVTLSGSADRAEINTGSQVVNETFDVAGQTILLDLPAGPFVRLPLLGAIVTQNRLLLGGAPATFSGDAMIQDVGGAARLDVLNFSPLGTGTTLSPGTGTASLTEGSLITNLLALAVDFGTKLGSPLIITGGTFDVGSPVPLRIHPGSLKSGDVTLIDFSSAASAVTASDFQVFPPLPTGFSLAVSGGKLLLSSAVKSDSDDDGLSDDWEDLYGPDTTSLSPTDNSDGDLYPALIEFALGLNPTIPDSPVLTPSIEMIGGEEYLTLTYPRNPDTIGLLGIFTQRSTDLGLTDPWSTDDTIWQSGTDSQITYRSIFPITSGTPEFLRLEVVKP